MNFCTKVHNELVYDLLTVNIMTYILPLFVHCLFAFLKNTLPSTTKFFCLDADCVDLNSLSYYPYIAL